LEISHGREFEVHGGLSRNKGVLGLILVCSSIALFGACGTTGHSAEVHSVSFSPDGNYLLTASHDGTARLWDAKTGQRFGALLPYGSVYTARFTSDGQRVVSSGAIASVCGMRITARRLAVLDYYANELAISLDGKKVAATDSTTIGVWEIATQRPIRLLETKEYVSSLEFSPDGTEVIFCDNGVNINFLDLNGGEVKRFALAAKRIERIAPLANSPLVLLGDGEGYVRLWNRDTGTEERKFKLHHSLHNIYPLSNGQVLSSSYSDFCIWSLIDGTVLRRFDGDALFTAISPDGKQIASVDGVMTESLPGWLIPIEVSVSGNRNWENTPEN
jgi:WD40 repeat protein